MPEIAERNIEAVRIFIESRTQVIAGFDSFIDINVLAVKILMDLNGVKNQRGCLRKVRLMFEEYKAALDEKREKDRDAKS